MSFHEVLLDQRYYGVNFFSIAGLFVTLGIGLSCVCRINAMRPKRWRINLEQLMYLIFAAWAMEAFTDLLFFRFFSGYDIAIGSGIMLHLHSTYFNWAGDDCVCDVLNFWRLKRLRGHNYGRRSTDHN